MTTTPHLLFIPGIGRSGTTWITRWLAQHPDVAHASEAYFFTHILRLIHSNDNPKGVLLPEEAAAFMRQVYHRLAGGCRLFIEKSPARLVLGRKLSVELLLHELFPEARVLIFYRDGKNFVHSFMHVPWERSVVPSMESMVTSWITEMSYIASRIQHPNTLLVRYEDLIQEPARMSSAILSFIGLQQHAPLQPWAAPINTRHSSYEPDRWRALLPEHAEEMRRMNPLLIQFGYEPVP